ncbi:hypothetical protein ACQY0O_007768 [Thecaphora frezii]
MSLFCACRKGPVGPRSGCGPCVSSYHFRSHARLGLRIPASLHLTPIPPPPPPPPPPQAVVAFAVIVSIMTHPSTPPATAPLLHPPPLFAPVAPCIYRSATPTPSSHAFLETLQLRTILSLTSELPSPTLSRFAKKHRIRFVHFGPSSSSLSSLPAPPSHLPGTTSGRLEILTTETLKDSLELLLDRRTHPVLVTDTSGIHEIGVLLACLRKLQRWNFATILVEYRNFAGNRARAANERLVEMFDTDLIALPEEEVLPRWFKQQVEWDEDEVDKANARGEEGG